MIGAFCDVDTLTNGRSAGMDTLQKTSLRTEVCESYERPKLLAKYPHPLEKQYAMKCDDGVACCDGTMYGFLK